MTERQTDALSGIILVVFGLTVAVTGGLQYRCRVALKSVLPQFVWRNYPELGTFGRDSRDFKKALVARERRFGSRR